jgi:mediator of RNA polymerase II transcription subunit 14
MHTAGRMCSVLNDFASHTEYLHYSARVAHTQVEMQLKNRGIPYTHVAAPASGVLPPATATHLRAALSPGVPALCVQAADILAGAPAAEAAEPNVRVLPLHWWDEARDVLGEGRPPQVVTSVKLKYVQQPMGGKGKGRANGDGGQAVIRLSKRIIYDTAQAVVSFLSEDVSNCVDEFLVEWAKVSKMVVIAREGKTSS